MLANLRIFFVTLVFVLSFTHNTFAATPPALFLPVNTDEVPNEDSGFLNSSDLEIESYRRFKLNPLVNLEEATSVVLTDFSGELHTANRLEIIHHPEDESFTWLGELSGESETSVVRFYKRGDLIKGKIVSKNFTSDLQYEFQSSKNNEAIYLERKLSLTGDTGLDCGVVSGAGESDDEESWWNDQISYLAYNTETGEAEYPCTESEEDCVEEEENVARMEFRVMVIYNEDAKKAAAPFWDNRNSDYLLAEARSELDFMSHITRKQGLNYEFILAGFHEVPLMSEPVDLEQQLYALKSEFEDSSTSLYSLRQADEADIVLTIVKKGQNFAGMAFNAEVSQQGRVSARVSSHPIAIISHSSMQSTTKYGVQHELGHIFGAHHEPYYATYHNGFFPYAYAYIDYYNTWNMSLMAYGDQCHLMYTQAEANWLFVENCYRIPLFSDPDYFYAGQPFGDVNTANNLQAIENIGPAVSRYYEFYYNVP